MAGIILYVPGNFQCLCGLIQGHFLVQSKYAEFGMIKSCTAERGYWQNHVNYILAINVSLHICKEPSAATIVFGVKYAISP